MKKEKFNQIKKHNKKINNKIEKIQKEIDYINKLYWRREGLFREKHNLKRQLKLL